MCVCNVGVIRYTAPTGAVERAPISYRCAEHAGDARKLEATRAAGILALWRSFYRPMRLALPAPSPGDTLA